MNTKVVRLRAQVVLSFIMVLAFGLAVWEATKWPLKTKLFPMVIAVPMLLLAVVNLINEWRKPEAAKGAPAHAKDEDDDSPDVAKASLHDSAIAYLDILPFFASLWVLGLLISVPLYTLLYLRFRSRDSWALSVGLAALMGLMTWVLFDRLLHLPLPKGFLGI